MPLPTIVPAASTTGTPPPSSNSAESKVPLLLPSTCTGSGSLAVRTGPHVTATQSEDLSGSFSSAKVLSSIPHLWVTSLENFVCFIEIWLVNVVQESIILVSIGAFTSIPPKLLLTPVNCWERHSVVFSTHSVMQVLAVYTESILSCWVPVKSIMVGHPLLVSLDLRYRKK